MSNSYFQFKKFIVHQDACAMKVSTDACLLGAFVDLKIAPKFILDIGTGTGLLSLMLAQQFTNANITSVEINKPAFLQATENVLQSDFKNQIQVVLQNINDFNTNTTFDFIISNPPFFENDLPASTEALNLAKHSTALTLESLAKNIQKYMKQDGNYLVIIPNARVAAFCKNLNAVGLNINKQINVKHNINKNTLNCIVGGGCGVQELIESEDFILKNIDETYTQEAVEKLSPYYLHL